MKVATPRLFLPFLIVVIVITSVPVIAEAQPQKVALSWRDSGYDLAAGYRYTISLESPCTWAHVCARAAVSAGPIEIELYGGHLKIVVNGETLFDEDLGETEATVNIVVDCDGSGTIEVSGQGNVGGFSIDHSYRIMVLTSTVSTWPQTVRSHVTISRQAMNCQVTNPSLTPVQENPANQVHYNPLLASIASALGGGAMIGVVIVVLILGILLVLWILGKLGGAKRLVKRALG